MRISLLWKILLSTSLSLILLFGITGWLVQNHAIRTTSLSLEAEVQSSLHAYESLWRARTEELSSISLILSNMSDVRASFGTRDQATIRDTAGELWSKISHRAAIFLVTDPGGKVIASLGGGNIPVSGELSAVPAAAPSFPHQASGFLMDEGRLFQIVVTPVYVQSPAGPALLNVLVAGYAIDSALVHELRQSTGGSDFIFSIGGKPVVSTLASAELPKDSFSRRTPLLDVQGRPIGELNILSSSSGANQRIAELRRQIAYVWLLAIAAGLVLTYLLAKRIVKPVRRLDDAAAEIAKGNYETRVPVDGNTYGQDELGRLAATFNAMSASIQSARQELVRQERISTIGRIATSIVHDLRNPLAAIYGGAEMLVDGELPPDAVKRLAGNMYRSSRQIQELLQDLVDVSRGKSPSLELCRLADVVDAACAALPAHHVQIHSEVPNDIEIPLERARMERVFTNLISNAIEAMPDGGSIHIRARRESAAIQVEVEDTGPGISKQIRSRLFEPFVSGGKKNGLGLGLALSRQTVLAHGGQIWADAKASPGARFFLRFPL